MKILFGYAVVLVGYTVVLVKNPVVLVIDYLALSRESGTLSGGESQRIRLASQIGLGFTYNP